jgi:hypothetical protein
MGIIYDLPRIGNEGDGFKQKGPTCWYYASKMLLKFHDKLSDKSSQTYIQFKKLHELRKALTSLGSEDHNARSNKDKVKAALEDMKNKLPKLIPDPGLFADHIKKVYDYLASENARVDEAIKMVDAIQDDWSKRISLLAGFVPAAGFRRYEASHVFASRQTLEDALRQNGPMYLGGSLSISAKVKKNPEPTAEQKEFAKVMFGDEKMVPIERVSVDRDKTFKAGKVQSSGDELLEVIELKADSSHAVALCGIDEETVFYKDPNGSHKLLSLPFDTMKANATGVITLECQNCTHKNKTLKLTK